MITKGKESHLPLTRWDQLLPIFSRVFVWGLLFYVLYILRGFFVLILLTFIFAYIQARGEQRLSKLIGSRGLRVTLVGLMLLGIWVMVGWFIVPPIREQTQLFVDRLPMHLQSLDRELLELQQRYPYLGEFLGEQEARNGGVWDRRNSPALSILHSVLGLEDGQHGKELMVELLKDVRHVGTFLLGIGSAFLLSLLFSFLIVLDLDRLTSSARELRNTRLRFIYLEVADSIVSFGQTLGRALEAQLVVAIVNTVLTALGIFLLGIGEKAAFLSLIVFICSFIPVAGVWVSSVPICLVALQEGGFYLVLLAIVLITAIHMVEAYVLNPKIYGQHFHMNPVIVLIILTVGGKLFGFWGLILGVPICTYIFGKAIRHEPSEIELTLGQTQ